MAGSTEDHYKSPLTEKELNENGTNNVGKNEVPEAEGKVMEMHEQYFCHRDH